VYRHGAHGFEPFFRLFLYFIIFLACLSSGGEAAPGGPLHIKNSQPLFISPGTPHLVRARCERSFELNFTYSSTFLVKESAAWSVGIDLEASVLEAELKMLAGDRTEISLYLPLISYNSGFMDGAIDAYHSAFGFGDYGRSRRPKNEFLLEVSRDGKTLIKGEAGEVAPGDLRAAIKRALHGGDPYVSIYGFVEFPTGNPDRGYGNGETDLALALLVDKALTERLSAYLNAGGVFPGDLRAGDDVDLKDYLYGTLGVEWDYSPGWSFGAQVFVQQSPYGTGIREVDVVSALLGVGARRRVGKKSALEFTFSEDLNTAGAPDFMLGAGYKYLY
jgi:hypothetical protein